VAAHLPTVKVAGGLHGVGGARMSGSGGYFCSMKKAGEAGFGWVRFPYGETTSVAVPLAHRLVGLVGLGWAREEGKGRWATMPDWAEKLKDLGNRILNLFGYWIGWIQKIEKDFESKPRFELSYK
jgi:hypothetical protein